MATEFKHELGKEAKDIVTGFSGIIIARVEYMTGCNQYGISRKAGEDGAIHPAEFFDEGRIQIIGDGVAPKDVQAEKKGGPSRDMPFKK